MNNKCIAVWLLVYLYSLGYFFYFINGLLWYAGILLMFLAIVGIQRRFFGDNSEEKRKSTLFLLASFVFSTSFSAICSLSSISSPPINIEVVILAISCLFTSLLFLSEIAVKN